MGISSNVDLIADQIKNYYIFQTKIELLLKKGINPFYDSTSNEIETIYIINKKWIQKWKEMAYYDVAKDSFDKIDAKNEKMLIKEVNNICKDLKKNVLKFFNLPLEDSKSEYKRIISRNMLNEEDFECLVNEKTYKLFKKMDDFFTWPWGKKVLYIEGIITDQTIYLLYEEYYTIKIFYYGLLEMENELIQLTANCLIIEDTKINTNQSEKSFKQFKNWLIENDTNTIIEIFNNKNMGFYQSKNLVLPSGLPFTLKNENLTLKYLEKEKRTNDINFQNVNKFRKIGLVNVGATCYMNATLQCFINVDSLTRYLLTESNYNNIINNINKCELTSSYCELLVNVCVMTKLLIIMNHKNLKILLVPKIHYSKELTQMILRI